MDIVAQYVLVATVIAGVIAIWLKLNTMQQQINNRQDDIANQIYTRIGELSIKVQNHELKVAENMVTRTELPGIIKATAQAVRGYK